MANILLTQELLPGSSQEGAKTICPELPQATFPLTSPEPPVPLTLLPLPAYQASQLRGSPHFTRHLYAYKLWRKATHPHPSHHEVKTHRTSRIKYVLFCETCFAFPDTHLFERENEFHTVGRSQQTSSVGFEWSASSSC